jgi:hypothetical protein
MCQRLIMNADYSNSFLLPPIFNYMYVNILSCTVIGHTTENCANVIKKNKDTLEPSEQYVDTDHAWRVCHSFHFDQV